MEYFVQKYEDIKQRMGAERKSLEVAKNKVAKVAATVSGKDKPTYQQPGQKDWLTDDMGKWEKDNG